MSADLYSTWLSPKQGDYPPPRADLELLYGSSDRASSPLLVGGDIHRESRAYFCRCDCRAVNLGG